jgi:glucose/arabinose dehydrogenase
MERHAGMETPVVESGRNYTWAPASAAYFHGSLYFGGLRGEALYEARLGRDPPEIVAHFLHQFGRIRDVVVGPDGRLYFSTSNTDGRGVPHENDDKILRVNPVGLR